MKNFTDRMEKYEGKADIMKALAHPIRLCIVKGLITEKGCNVNEMKDCLDIPQSTLSQHLAKLRHLNILEGRRDGVKVNYYVINNKAKKVVNALFSDGDYQEQEEKKDE